MLSRVQCAVATGVTSRGLFRDFVLVPFSIRGSGVVIGWGASDLSGTYIPLRAGAVAVSLCAVGGAIVLRAVYSAHRTPPYPLSSAKGLVYKQQMKRLLAQVGCLLLQ